jgi:hypothetical protein
VVLVDAISHSESEPPYFVTICIEVVMQVKLLLEDEVSCTLFVTNFVIVLAANEMFLFVHFLHKDGDNPMELLQGDKLNQVMDKFVELYSPNIRNLMSSLKHHSKSQAYLSNILTFKYKNGYAYIQETIFQVNSLEKKCSLSKCPCTKMPIDLIWCSECNLEATFKHVDHVKCVDGWMTLVCHVYDLVYCKVMTIALCDM